MGKLIYTLLIVLRRAGERARQAFKPCEAAAPPGIGKGIDRDAVDGMIAVKRGVGGEGPGRTYDIRPSAARAEVEHDVPRKAQQRARGERGESAQLLRVRISELRRRKKMTQDAQELFWLERRMAALAPMLRQMNELAELTAHYYERGYDRNEGYRV